MGTINAENGIEEFESLSEFIFGVGADDEVKTRPAVRSRYALHYVSSHSGTIQIVVGTLRIHQSEYATLRTDEGVEYMVCGFGLSDRDEGEVVKESADDRRKVGEFDSVHAVRE